MQERTAAGAAMWVAGGMALIAFSDNFIPLVADRMGLWQFQVMRAGMVLPAVLLAVLAFGRLRLIMPVSAWRIAVRSLLSIVALMMYFAAVPSVSISIAAAGLFTSPLWVAFFTAALLGERVGPRRIMGAALGFVGVCIVLGVGTQPIRPMAMVALAGGAFYALSVIWTRRQCAGESALCMSFWQFVGFILLGGCGLAGLPVLEAAFGGVEGADFALRPWIAPDATAFALALLIGASGIAATTCIAVGYRSAESSFIGIFDFSFLVWAPLISWLLWGEVLSLRVAFGMGLIVFAGIMAMWSGLRRPAPA
ncbi:DMT family transporter [Limibaculum sp. M0105]|uniref:DMT family transporter n=1 Tax=Thermohalobaculum xanthum TaxID=2753746 RepID=A0A8J7SED0_9RHOB|nr:DMT family transporter [Thermohalobaculum xanthum]MBK0399421.1 DMT family transporter [Thermohalobaculum xanthum]